MKKTLPSFMLYVLIALPFFLPHAYAFALQPVINADAVLGHTNAQRYKEDLPFLASNKLLSEVARKKMVDLFTNQYFAHESPSGDSVSDLAKSVGYEYIVVGENLALGDFASSKAVVDAWMNSEGHKKNILSKSYSEIGIASGRSSYKGRTTWIVVQSFGFPKSSCPAIDKELEQTIDVYQVKLDILSKIAEMRKELLSETEGTLEERKSYVESYNVAARLYNETVDAYRKLIKEYNEEVGEFNQCLKDAVSSTAD